MIRFWKSGCLFGFATCLATLAAIGCHASPPPGEDGSGVTPPAEQSRLLQARIAAKNDVAWRLLRGELSLVEAAAWFRYLNDQPPVQPCDFRQQCPGSTDGEKACRHVILWVRNLLWDEGPELAEMVAACYQDELEDLLADGPVELPW
jgi:hypothetical protein